MTALLEIRGLVKVYRLRTGLTSRLGLAADAVSFDIERGKTLALVGESGSVRRRLPVACSGSRSRAGEVVVLDGEPITGLKAPS